MINPMLMALVLDATSPEQTVRWTSNERGIVGAVGRKIGEKAAEKKHHKMENKIEELHKMNEEAALLAHKGNYAMSYEAVERIEVKDTMHEGNRKIKIYLNDGSGPPLSRKSRMFMMEYIDEGMAVDAIKQLREHSPIEIK